MPNNEFKEVLKQLDARKYRQLARTLPWPYNGMVNDIIGSIQTKGNYLSALGLACYTEICGRRILFRGDNTVEGWQCFNEFLKYMGLASLLERQIKFEGKSLKIKDAVRNGLVHRYFMKAEPGVVSMITADPVANRTGFLIEDSGKLVMVVVPYFKLFCGGLRKARDEGRLT